MIFLNVRTPYSLLYGAMTNAELSEMAASMGMPAIGCADNGNFYGLFDFRDKCRARSIKPVTGVNFLRKDGNLILFARNYNGFRQLSSLLSAINLRDRNSEPESIDLIPYITSDVVCITDIESIISVLPPSTLIWYPLLFPRIDSLKRAQSMGIPPVAVPEISWGTTLDYKVHCILRAIDNNSIYTPPVKMPPSPERWKAMFSFSPASINATYQIADLCDDFSMDQGTIFPRLSGNSAETLRINTIDGAMKRYGELSEAVIERIEYELNIINKKGFADYFLIVQDIVSKASRTCGRGSGAASIVSYSLGITNVDPIRYNLFFERFLNMERVDPPDIDVDFAWDERDAIIDSAMEKYGREHCAMVCNHVHFKPKSAVREVARAFGIPDGEITAMQKALSRHGRDHGRRPWSERFYTTTSFELDSPWDEITSVAQRLNHFPRYISVHPGGMVITPDPISSRVPVEMAPKGVPIINWEKDWTEEAGLVKIDLLGNRSLAVIRDTLENIRENGIEIPESFRDPALDPETINLMARGETMGVFYVESPAMRQLQRKTKHGDFEHLVIHSSIIRPAANKYINEYVARLRGKKYKPLHPVLEKILSETYGIMCYQEDVSRTAMALAGFSEGKADNLRRILSKKNKEVKLREYYIDFREGAISRGISEDVITEVWNMILSFDGYSFCKPHSASYAMVSFQSGYLKTHFGAEFIAAVLSNMGGFYSPSAYVSEARRLGVRVAPPDVNESQWKYRGSGGVLRIGFMAISELRQDTAKRIVRMRETEGPYTDCDDFIRRVQPFPADFELLVNLGALDSISNSQTRQEILWHYALRDNFNPSKPTLFHEEFPVPGKASRPVPLRQQRQFFFEKCGFLADEHPLVLFDIPAFIRRQCIKAIDLEHHIDRFVTVMGWPVTRRVLTTIKGEMMEFVSFEDETAIYETVLFPEMYGKYGDDVAFLRPFVVSGTVKSEFGEISLIVERVEKI
ncbi:DNA polymerase III subunit alpha [Myxococcota bacterium]|nr:DNA polymerase III subunit alpha [Myxococcota bacterium]MBU1498019.1 DNA polymerase III subunit alpha [Myxococcota bacterium]